MDTNQSKSSAMLLSIALVATLFSSFSDAADTSFEDLENFYNPKTFHQSGFGGKFNPSTPIGDKNRRLLEEVDVVIPKSAVKHAIPSLGRPNIENLFGHYVHDEHRSPFSSVLYQRSDEELLAEQQEYEVKMEKVREEWGAWDFKDESDVVRPVANFDETPYKDMNNDDFPENAWQTDPKYVADFIEEADKYVDRMIEGIYAEYGHPTKKADGTILSDAEIEERNNLFKINVNDAGNIGDVGFAYISEAGMKALGRKLLHGMMTNDEFYFVLGGHSAAAGHGNNFVQQKTMQFHYVMEPVFQKLGMRLISRNLAMGGLGTLHYSMGGAELYGEKDFIMWDSAMTEKQAGAIDLFNKQALMNGERVPIIFNQYINNLVNEVGGDLWYGDVSTSNDFLPITTGIEQALTLPLAARYQRCELSVQELCGDRNNPNKYDAYCWVDRKDGYPPKTQSSGFSSQASWHPGNRYHQLESRKAAMTMLQGFKVALEMWKSGIEADGFPLKESYWHVGDTYTTIQNNLNSYVNGEGKGTSDCDEFFKEFGLDRVCRTSMHGMSEFLPVNLGVQNSIVANMKVASNGWVPKYEVEKVYSGIDLLHPHWKIPDSEVDLHAIAIATTYKKPSIDEDVENSRLLRTKSTTKQSSDTKRQSTEAHPSLRRNLDSDEVVPGLGWGIDNSKGDFEVTGYCDGSSNSYDCHRSGKYNCILSGHNDARITVSGDGLSGWLVVQIPSIKAGLILARMEWWHPRDHWYLTEDWTEVNNGQRALGKVQDWPDDVMIDIAINGNIVSTWDKAYFDSINREVAYNMSFYKFFDDENFTDKDDGEPVEFGLRIRSESNPKGAGLSISHIYYA